MMLVLKTLLNSEIRMMVKLASGKTQFKMTVKMMLVLKTLQRREHINIYMV